jgi:uncharacterized membrane protein
MTSTAASKRIASIDVVRGLVMLVMTVDHVRETFFLQHQVAGPMDVASSDPGLFFTRMAGHFCAPIFVFLTGLSAWLYAHPADRRRDATGFLVKRGLLLLALELSVVNFAWTGSLAPSAIYLQVIWAIGLSMLALAWLHRLPCDVLALLDALIVLAHNMFDVLRFEPGSTGQHRGGDLDRARTARFPFAGTRAGEGELSRARLDRRDPAGLRRRSPLCPRRQRRRATVLADNRRRQLPRRAAGAARGQRVRRTRAVAAAGGPAT